MMVPVRGKPKDSQEMRVECIECQSLICLQIALQHKDAGGKIDHGAHKVWGFRETGF